MDGIAETRLEFRTRDDRVLAVDLYARFNEVRGKYTVTQYIQRKKIRTFPEFRDPHRTDQWHPSKNPSSARPGSQRGLLKPCLYMLIARDKYRFLLGMTRNLYMRIYQLRLIYGEFDLASSCVIHGSEAHLQKLEDHLQFVFEEYYAPRPTPLDEEQRDWYDLDCFWYAKNEVRRLNNFREVKIYRIWERIDLNNYIVGDTGLNQEGVDIAAAKGKSGFCAEKNRYPAAE